MDCKEIGWIDMVLDRKKWQAVVNVIMFWVSYHLMHLLSG
jgi:hypothetical protein